MTGDLRSRVLDLLAQQQRIMAVKLVRDETGVGLRSAVDYCSALANGRGPDAIALDLAAGSLATRVRMLLATNDRDSAIRLVRSETGMTETESATFIAALD